MNNKLALLALIPLVSFMLVPVVTAASVPSSNTIAVGATVSCESYPGSGVTSGAWLTYAGETIAISCTQGNIHSVNGLWPVIGGQASYTATVFAGRNHYTEHGKFGVNNCGSTLYGKQDAVKYGEEVAYGTFQMTACVEIET